MEDRGNQLNNNGNVSRNKRNLKCRAESRNLRLSTRRRSKRAFWRKRAQLKKAVVDLAVSDESYVNDAAVVQNENILCSAMEVPLQVEDRQLVEHVPHEYEEEIIIEEIVEEIKDTKHATVTEIADSTTSQDQHEEIKCGNDEECGKYGREEEKKFQDEQQPSISAEVGSKGPVYESDNENWIRQKRSSSEAEDVNMASEGHALEEIKQLESDNDDRTTDWNEDCVEEIVVASGTEDTIMIENANTKHLQKDLPAVSMVPQDRQPPIPEDVGRQDTEEDDFWVEERVSASQPEEQYLEGLTFTDFRYVFKRIKDIANHSPITGCGIEHFTISGAPRRIGLVKTYTVQCGMCQYTERIRCLPEDDTAMDINDAAVSGTMVTGGGYNQLEEMLAAMNVQCMSKKLYEKCQETIIDGFEAAAKEEMKQAGEEEKALAIARGDVDPQSQLPVISVIADGSWLKRSYRGGLYNSSSGVGIIIGYATKKALFYSVKNKFCIICITAAKKRERPREHRCYKNWGRDQTSTGMESAAILEGFMCSVEMHGLIYNVLVGDGDSDVYKKIRDRDPYKDYKIEVKKIECRNHILRGFCRELRETMSKGPFKKVRDLVKNNIIRMRVGVQKAARYRYLEQLPMDQRIQSFKEDLKNIPSHVFGEHKDCKKIEYFCNKYADPKEINHVPELEKKGLFQYLQVPFRRIFAHAESMLYGLNTNIAECANNMIATHCGGRRINLSRKGSYQGRVGGSIVKLNYKSVLSRIALVMNKRPSAILLRMEAHRRHAIEKAKEYKKAAKASSFRQKIQSCDKDYGPNAEKPDMGPADFKSESQRHMAMLVEWQVSRFEIEKNTRDQANDQRWKWYCKKLLIASNFGRVCRLKEDTPRGNIVQTILYSQLLSTEEQEYERGNKKFALIKLREELQIDVQRCGLFIDCEEPYLAATPDGLIGEDSLVEVKCPPSARNFLPEEAIRELPEVRRIFRGDAMNTIHNYYYQVQGLLHITRRERALFCLWTPKGMKITKVEKNDKFWEREMKQKLKTFFNDCMLPEIVDSRYKRGMAIREPSYVPTAEAKAEKKKKVEQEEILT